MKGRSKIFRNKNYIINFCKKYASRKIKIIEIHNRPEYLIYIKKYFPNSKINIIFHNDPLSIRGSIKKEERENIISSCNKVIFISHWIQQKFFSEFKNSNLSNTVIIPHGVNKIKNINLNQKKKKYLICCQIKQR